MSVGIDWTSHALHVLDDGDNDEMIVGKERLNKMKRITDKLILFRGFMFPFF